MNSKALATSMLSDLRAAHAGVRVCLTEMEALTSRREVSQLEFTQARLRISQASLARRSRFNAACAWLRQNATSERRAIIEELAQRDRQLLSASASHVTKWTADRIMADWNGYCAASRQIRRAMEEELTAEQVKLFPLLVGGR